jgi:hypothetical protein
MFILKSIIDQYCNMKDGRVFACFVDFQKAFDKVIHTGILIKLLDKLQILQYNKKHVHV